jgi:Zn-dependent metalloprotease
MRVEALIAISMSFALAGEARAVGPGPAALAAIRADQPARAARARSRLLALRGAMGLGAQDGFVARRAFTNEQGRVIVHVDHTFAGFRVFGSGAIAHVLPDGEIRALDGGLVRGVAVAGAPRLPADEAAEIALEHLAPTKPIAKPIVERVVFPARAIGGLASRIDPASGRVVLDRKLTVYARLAAPFVWAYEVNTGLAHTAEGLRELVYVIDANTGSILRITDELRASSPAPMPAQASGFGYYRGHVTLDTSQMGDGTFALYDTTRGTLPNPALQHMSTSMPASDAPGWSPTGMQLWYEQHDATGMPAGDFLFQSNPADNWGDGMLLSGWGQEGAPNGQTAGVDALAAMQTTWDFLSHVFGRNGVDGMGTSVFAEVLLTDMGNTDNGYWSPGVAGLLLGAGSYPSNPNGLQSVTDLDIIAHEMFHGVAWSTAHLYDNSGLEEAGIDEAGADYFAQMVKAWSARGASAPADRIPDTGTDWQFGMGINHGTPLRYMDHPSKDQRSVDAWYSGINYMDGHFSSGPLNRALYFLSQGASSHPGDDNYSPYLPNGMTGIGNDATARIWWKTLTERLHSTGTGTATVTYDAARSEAIAVALDLYTNDPDKVVAVENAFAAVNVGDAHGAAPHTKVVFADWRNGDYVETHHPAGWANKQFFPKNETVRPRITVLNNANTAVTWSLGGPSLFNGADQLTEAGGRINPDGSWTTPNQMGWHALTATSVADPLQFAEGRAFLVDLDTDMDLEQDALDMGGVAFSWFLSTSLTYSHSVLEAPWVDDAYVSIFVDAVRAAWPAK